MNKYFIMEKHFYPISKNLYNIYALFTREPYVNYFAKEESFYTDKNGLLAVVVFDYTDRDYNAILMSRDSSKQYRAEGIKIDFRSIKEAEDWLESEAKSNRISHHEEADFFDLFSVIVKKKNLHPHFEHLNEYDGVLAAKQVIQEISYHYKDIDGNFIDQFQSLNGFDARIWELYLFCFCREEYFSFKRDSYAPDFMIEKEGIEIALEAVIINRIEKTREGILNATRSPLSPEEIDEKLKNEVPLKYASALTSKLNKKYWELPHVKGKPIVIAVADFHDVMSMTWSFQALLEYLYAKKILHEHDEYGNLVIEYSGIQEFTKPSGATVQAGFFQQPESENISAILFNPSGTLSKFNRMGKQAGLGSNKSTLIRMGTCHNHDKNASKPYFFQYTVDENTRETWAEGMSMFHNPDALYPIDPNLFPSIAHHFEIDGKILSLFPQFFPYSSFTQNLVAKP